MGEMDAVQTAVCDVKMKHLEDRIDKIETLANDIHKLTLSVERLTITVQNMVSEQDLQKERIAAIESKDGEMWRTLVKYVLTAIAGAIIGYAMKHVGF